MKLQILLFMLSFIPSVGCGMKNNENDSAKLDLKNSAKIPIVYSDEYNISLGGIEELHPFDTKKYGKIFEYLKNAFKITLDSVFIPEAVSDADLERIHTKEYLESLNESSSIAKVAETQLLKMVPADTLKRKLLYPMRLASGGTVLSSKLAMEFGWSVNLSGGYHHAKSGEGSGFCFFSDIALAANKLWDEDKDLKIMIVDLDAHQGNGYEDIFKDDPKIIVFDVYNSDIYPNDTQAKKFIDYKFELESGTTDNDYLDLLNKELLKALEESKPDFIIYNAGSDIYEEDELGMLNVTKNGIARRDEIVFRSAISRKIPITMLLSGGYHKKSWESVAESIENILKNVVQR